MKSRHRGFTLVECLVVLTVLGAVLSTVMLALHSMSMTHQRIHNALARRQQITRFTEQFRTDAHQARTATLDRPNEAASSATDLVLAISDQESIVYRLFSERIERTLNRDGQVVHRDLFPVQPLMTAGWQIDRERSIPRLTVSLVIPAMDFTEEAQPTRSVLVAAILHPVLVRTPTP